MKTVEEVLAFAKWLDEHNRKKAAYWLLAGDDRACDQYTYAAGCARAIARYIEHDGEGA